MRNTFSFILLLLCLSVSGQMVETQLMAGTAKINITPDDKAPLHDSLYARALVLEVGDQRLAFISIDLAIFTSQRAVDICKEKYNLANLMICNSHTHSGPKSPKDQSYNTFYEDRIIEAVGEAANNLFPAKITAGRKTFPQLGFNRLIIREDGHARESWHGDDHYNVENPERIPFGPVDPEVGVIKIEDMQGDTRVIIMNYACHADIVCFNYEISADYPGVACRKVEEAFGGKVNCLFVQGAGGNIESLQISRRRTGPDDPIKSDYKPMERTGELLAYEVIKLANQLHVTNEKTSLRYQTSAMQFTGRFNKSLKYNVALSTLLINNNIVIATCPGELFVQLQLNWKKQIELTPTIPFVFGYTWSEKDWPGYVPDVRSAALGGYGADQSPRLIEVGAGEAMMTKQLENFYVLNGLMRITPP